MDKQNLVITSHVQHFLHFVSTHPDIEKPIGSGLHSIYIKKVNGLDEVLQKFELKYPFNDNVKLKCIELNDAIIIDCQCIALGDYDSLIETLKQKNITYVYIPKHLKSVQ